MPAMPGLSPVQLVISVAIVIPLFVALAVFLSMMFGNQDD
jgi:hypothetical protein